MTTRCQSQGRIKVFMMGCGSRTFLAFRSLGLTGGCNILNGWDGFSVGVSVDKIQLPLQHANGVLTKNMFDFLCVVMHVVRGIVCRICGVAFPKAVVSDNGLCTAHAIGREVELSLHATGLPSRHVPVRGMSSPLLSKFGLCFWPARSRSLLPS